MWSYFVGSLSEFLLEIQPPKKRHRHTTPPQSSAVYLGGFPIGGGYICGLQGGKSDLSGVPMTFWQPSSEVKCHSCAQI